MKTHIILVVTVFLFSCHSNEGSIQSKKNVDVVVNHSDSSNIASKSSLSFPDSIASKYELSIAQVHRHTLIDSIYYTGMYSDASFIGDTVYDVHNGFKSAIITYRDGRSCLYKFLLTFNVSNKNVDQKIIYSECDWDESADYITLDYKIINDSTIETTETYIPANTKTRKIEKLKWRVTGLGKIDLINTITGG